MVFTDGLRGFFFGDTPVTIECLMERAPDETIAWWAEQEWYEPPAGLTGHINADNLYIVYNPSGGAEVHIRDDEDSVYGLYMGGGGHIRNHISAEDVA